MATVELKAHKGVRNDVSSERFDKSDLLVGSNIDIDETGKVFRRLGTTLLSAGSTSSLWSNGKRAFFVRSSALYELFPDLSTNLLVTGVGSYVSYTSIEDTVYWSDTAQSGRIKDGQNDTWGVPVPPNNFTLTATFGDLPAGRYGVTIVRLRNGMESGARRARFIDLPANSGMSIAGLEGGYDKRVYITRPDGEMFFAAAETADTSLVVRGFWSDALPLRTQFKFPAPAGQVVGTFAGRTFVAKDNVLYHSDPFETELFNLRSGFTVFDSVINIFAPVNDGVFVATEKRTYFLAGLNPSEWQQTVVLPRGGVRGTLVTPRNDLVLKEGVQGVVVVWMSHTGAVLGTTGGELVFLTSNRYVMPSASTGAGIVKIRSGTPQYVASLFD